MVSHAEFSKYFFFIPQLNSLLPSYFPVFSIPNYCKETPVVDKMQKYPTHSKNCENTCGKLKVHLNKCSVPFEKGYELKTGQWDQKVYSIQYLGIGLILLL